VLEADAPWPLAAGYLGQGAELVLFDEDGRELARWTGEVAEPLVSLGRLAGRHSNGE
jgi:hypothetical protein